MTAASAMSSMMRGAGGPAGIALQRQQVAVDDADGVQCRVQAERCAADRARGSAGAGGLRIVVGG